MNENAALIRRWFEEAWNQGNDAAIDEIIAPDCVIHGMAGPDGREPVGAAAFRPLLQATRAAFPDIHIRVDDAISDADTIAARCTVFGTHLGEWMGVPPTGRKVEITGMTFGTVKDGQLVEGWNNFDFASLYQQVSAPLSA